MQGNRISLIAICDDSNTVQDIARDSAQHIFYLGLSITGYCCEHILYCVMLADTPTTHMSAEKHTAHNIVLYPLHGMIVIALLGFSVGCTFNYGVSKYE